MAVSRTQFVVSKSYAAAGSITSMASGTLSPAATAGDLLIFAVSIDKASGAINTPSGWTAIATQTGTSTSIAVFGKVAAGGETSVTATWTTAAAGAATVLAEYSGAAASGWLGGVNLPTYSDTARTSMALDPAAAVTAGRAIAVLTMDTADTVAGFTPTATGFTHVTTVGGDTAPATPSGQPGIAYLESTAALTAGQDMASTTFTWTTSDQVQGAVFVVYDAAAGAPTVSAALSGSGTLTAVSTPAASGGAALGGAGTLTATARAAAVQPAALSGSGSLAVSQQLVAVSRTAALSGGGSLTASSAPTVSRPAALGGAGTLTATVSGFATAGLSGSGTLTAGQLAAVVRAAALSGAGTLTTTQQLAAARVAALSGAGTLTAAVVFAVARAAALTGNGTLLARAIYRLAWWNGTQWMRLTPKVWTGTSWDDVPVTVTPS